MEEKNEKCFDPGLQTEENFYVRPRAANKKMKAAQTMLQTVYLYGISGCGKTTFIRNYMGKRRYHYFSAEQLKEEELEISFSGKQNIVVIDDLHQLRTDDLREKLRYLQRGKMSGLFCLEEVECHHGFFLFIIDECLPLLRKRIFCFRKLR